MKSGKRCAICGRQAAARANNVAWLCLEHAREATIASLMAGQPVVEAIRGKPQYLLVPSSTLSKN